jgi:lipopolysaccharide/colanic/teichoic acid biosynthesis glycosyltransferase
MSTHDVPSPVAMATGEPGAVARRVFDIVCAVAALILLAPLMLLVAAAIWVESGRPILFAQARLGRNGWPFVMYKFRKFAPDGGADPRPLTMERDSRLTAVGRLLAATKLDELPQFWNVLRGDMSIVGPRPESLAFADCFRDGFEQVLMHRPGLLGPSQIMFRHEARLYPWDADPVAFYRQVLFPAKARIDLGYFPDRTFLADLKWVVLGVLAVFGHAPRGMSVGG